MSGTCALPASWIAPIAVAFSSLTLAPPTIADQPHPAFVDRQQLSEVAQAVAADREPWHQAAADLLRHAEAALDQPTRSVTDNGGGNEWSTDRPYEGTGDGIVNPDSDRHDYEAAIEVCAAVRTLGLAYALTADERYAAKALELIGSWALDDQTRQTPGFTNTQSRIEMAITIPGLIYGAALIWDYTGWENVQRDAMRAWARDYLDDVDDNPGPRNNFENWRLVLAMSLAAFVGDADAIDRAVEQWKLIVPTQLDDDGFLPAELGRTRSLDYSTYALNAMVQGAEIARHFGHDLYTWRDDSGRGLVAALDAHAPYVLDPESWNHEQIAPYDGANVALYELAYAALRKPLYRDIIDHYGRPLSEERTMGPVTLTHTNQ